MNINAPSTTFQDDTLSNTLNQAIDAYLDGEYTTAARLFDFALTSDPANQLALEYQAKTRHALETGYLPQRRVPATVRQALNLAILRCMTGDFEMATVEYQRACQLCSEAGIERWSELQQFVEDMALAKRQQQDRIALLAEAGKGRFEAVLAELDGPALNLFSRGERERLYADVQSALTLEASAINRQPMPYTQDFLTGFINQRSEITRLRTRWPECNRLARLETLLAAQGSAWVEEILARTRHYLDGVAISPPDRLASLMALYGLLERIIPILPEMNGPVERTIRTLRGEIRRLEPVASAYTQLSLLLEEEQHAPLPHSLTLLQQAIEAAKAAGAHQPIEINRLFDRVFMRTSQAMKEQKAQLAQRLLSFLHDPLFEHTIQPSELMELEARVNGSKNRLFGRPRL